jgi:predicted negative regulator of RcsB-dependent stress response
LAKRKIKKKEIKRTEEFITFGGKVVNWCKENIKTVTALAAGVALLLVIVGVVFVYKANREAHAANLYQKALALYPSGSPGGDNLTDYAQATPALEEIQQRYGSTAVATTALVDLGNIYFDQGAYDKTILCYNDFLQRTDRSHPLHDPVLMSLGETYEAKESYEDALMTYQRLAKDGAPVYQTQAQLYLGRVYEAKGDKSQAMVHYDNYLNESPTPLFGEWIRIKLRRWQQEEKPEAGG